MKKDSIESRIERLEEELKKLKDDLKRPEKEKVAPKSVPSVKKKVVPPKEEPSVIKKEIPPKAIEKPETTQKPPSERYNRWLEFERMIGERWLVWVGALVFAAGFAIFLKYAFEQGWLNEGARIILGFSCGFMLIWFAEFLFRKKFIPLAQGISGLGLIVLYLTIFTAYHFYQMFSPVVSFSLFFLVTIGGMTIAMLHNAFPTAFLSIFGAFATPLLLADPTSTVYYEPFLFSYLFIINIGVLFVSSVKRWRTISLVSFILTIIYFGSWYIQEYTSSDFSLAAGFATAYFILFSFMSTPHSIIGKKKSNWEDLVLVILNPVIFFLIAYTILIDRGDTNIIPYVPLGMAIYHFILSHIIRKINAQDKLLYAGLMGTAVGLLTLPVPMIVKSYWITAAWSIEALILILVGSVIERKPLRIGGFIVFLLVAMRLFTVDSLVWFHRIAHHFLFFNLKFLAHFISTLSFGIGALIFSRFKNISVKERIYKVPLWTLFIGALFWITNHDLISYFAGLKGTAGRMIWSYSTILWSVFFSWLLVQGILIKNKPLRIAGLSLMAATAVKVLFFDITFLYNYYSYGYPFLINAKSLSFAIFLGSIVICALLYSKKQKLGIVYEKNGLFLLWGTFATMLFLCLNFEIFSYFSPIEREIRMTRFLFTSMIWTGFTFWFLIAGILRRDLKLRIVGFILVGATAFKLFLIDTPLLYRYSYGYPFILNLKFLSLALLLGVIASSVLLYVRKGINEEKKGGITVPVLWTAFVSLLFVGLNVEIISYFGRFEITAIRLESFIFTTILWAIFSLFLILFGFRNKITPLRITGLVLATLTFFKIILEDSSILYTYSYGFPFLLNLKFASAVVLLFVIAYAAVLYADRKEVVIGFEKGMVPYLWSLFLVLLFIEIHSQATFSLYRVWNLGEQRAAFALSLLWVLYGLGLLLVGMLRKILPLRISALCLFGITLCKVFFVDLRFTGKLYKMFVLLGIGGIFLIAAYFYRKYRQRL